MPDYQHIDTGRANASPDGGVMRRMYPNHTITAYFLVPSVTHLQTSSKRQCSGDAFEIPQISPKGNGLLARNGATASV